MGEWYWIGAVVGIGAGIGVFVAALAGTDRRLIVAGSLLAAVAAAGLGLGLEDWDEAAGGAAGGLAGALGAAQFVLGTLRRGGTRSGTAMLFFLGGLGVAALGFVPGVGYAEAALVPVLGLRLRRRAGDRHAGLRILARD